MQGHAYSRAGLGSRCERAGVEVQGIARSATNSGFTQPNRSAAATAAAATGVRTGERVPSSAIPARRAASTTVLQTATRTILKLPLPQLPARVPVAHSTVSRVSLCRRIAIQEAAGPRSRASNQLSHAASRPASRMTAYKDRSDIDATGVRRHVSALPN